MDADLRRVILLGAGAVAGYAAVMAVNPARPSLRDGLRCLLRYKQIWALPVVFSLCYSAFTVSMRWYEGTVLQDGRTVIVPWGGWQPPAWQDVFARSWLPTVEGAAAIFNYIVTPFPLSVFVALCFLVNWRGYQGVVCRGLQKRFGRSWGVAVHALLVTAAVAAACKPVLFVGLTSLNAYVAGPDLLRWGMVINSVGFLFEYLLGVGVQIYLILLCFVWVRGITFDFDRVRRFALRRFAYVGRWAVIVLAISTAGINLPLIIDFFQPSDQRESPAWIERTVQGTHWLLAVALLAFCSLQILLVFHNETLRAACLDHFRLLRRYGLHVGWLFVVSLLHFFVLVVANAFLSQALGRWTWPAVAWGLVVYPVLWRSLASWLLASWVCLFKRCESGRADADELVRF